ncbi:hypothetical protein U9M48_027267 [Paspalum notatum var. saurae]|uniref:Transposase-associated domain-containing protein n=1 Tax=Paspalum notatum var. saurae TaxID=547442 RepID=A0AAQ3TW72_PASNO
MAAPSSFLGASSSNSRTAGCVTVNWPSVGQAHTSMDRQWMYKDRRTVEFLGCLGVFLETAEKHKKSSSFKSSPCIDCKKEKEYLSSKILHDHLLRRGFMAGYICWTKHGELGVVEGEDDYEEEGNIDFTQFNSFADTLMGDSDDEYNIDALAQMLHDAKENRDNKKDWKKLEPSTTDLVLNQVGTRDHTYLFLAKGKNRKSQQNQRRKWLENHNQLRKHKSAPHKFYDTTVLPIPQRQKKTYVDDQFGKFIEDILNNKKPLLSIEVVHLTEECSAAILNQPPQKKKDLGNPTISCSIGTQHFDQALCDLGASMSVIPKIVFGKLKHATRAPTAMCL